MGWLQILLLILQYGPSVVKLIQEIIKLIEEISGLLGDEEMPGVGNGKKFKNDQKATLETGISHLKRTRRKDLLIQQKEMLNRTRYKLGN